MRSSTSKSPFGQSLLLLLLLLLVVSFCAAQPNGGAKKGQPAPQQPGTNNPNNSNHASTASIATPAPTAAEDATQTKTSTTTSTSTISYDHVMEFHIWTSQEIHSTLNDWQTRYPDLIQVSTAQADFQLPRTGSSDDCPFDSGSGSGCLNYYAIVQDHVKHPLGTSSSNRLPTMLLSGAVHGNERVGPTAVMETAKLLLDAATCQAALHNQNSTSTSCQDVLYSTYGLSATERTWLARLVATRRLIIVPTANVLGYVQDVRTEAGYDVNRDFPFDQLDATSCMNTIAARTLNEIFRKYLISYSFTFHAGTEMIGYEWGNPSWYGVLSPDDTAQDQLATAFSGIAGGFTSPQDGSTHPNYLYGDMNSIIYYVRGGMEDWAYAGSWDTQHMITCNPTTYGGYDAAKTTYDGGMLRSFNMLVETSNEKTPPDADLGTSWNVLQVNNQGPTPFDSADLKSMRQANGHVSRNMRIALAAMDLLQPHVQMLRVLDTTATTSNALLPDLTGQPLQPPQSTAVLNMCTSSGFAMQSLFDSGELPAVALRSPMTTTTTMTFQWTVAGVFNVDDTQLWVAQVGGNQVIAQSAGIPNANTWLTQYLCGDPNDDTVAAAKRMDPTSLQANFVRIPAAAIVSSNYVHTAQGQFHPQGASPTVNDLSDTVKGPVLESVVDMASLLGWTDASNDEGRPIYLLVVAHAQVDSAWTELPTAQPVGPSNTPPQSHMVNARTNPDWLFTNAQGHVLQGQQVWFSQPVLIRIPPASDGSSSASVEASSGGGRRQQEQPPTVRQSSLRGQQQQFQPRSGRVIAGEQPLRVRP